MTLYELSEAGRQLYELLQAEEIDEQTVCDTLESMGAAEKLENCCKIVRQFEADQAVLEAEEKRLKAKRDRAKNGVIRVKSNLLAFLSASGQKKAAAGIFTVVKSERKAVQITDAKLLPKAVLIEQEPKVSKIEIKRLIEAGQTVPGAEMVVNQSLTIR